MSANPNWREDKILENRSKSPETTKLAALVARLTRLGRTVQARNAVEDIAGQVDDWANNGKNVNAPEALVVLEAVTIALGLGH